MRSTVGVRQRARLCRLDHKRAQLLGLACLFKILERVLEIRLDTSFNELSPRGTAFAAHQREQGQGISKHLLSQVTFALSLPSLKSAVSPLCKPKRRICREHAQSEKHRQEICKRLVIFVPAVNPCLAKQTNMPEFVSDCSNQTDRKRTRLNSSHLV